VQEPVAGPAAADQAGDQGGLPPIVDLLWRRGTERPRRGPRPGLTLDQVVDAAVAVADEDGLAAVSMQRIAGDLGFTTMSLYRYVASKDDLLVLMYDAACGEAPTVEPGTPWRPALAEWARRNRSVLEAHPWMVELPISGPPTGPRMLGWVEAGLRALAPTPLDEGEKVAVVLLVSGYVLQSVRLVAELAKAAAGGALPAWLAVPYPDLLRGVLGPDTHPDLLSAVAAGAFDMDDDPDADFEFGLGRTLDGVAALVDRHAV
jgi:AcrR family transcriptional regulator